MPTNTAFGPQGPNYTTTRPAADPKASAGTDTWFKNCSSAGAKDGTFATADFFNVNIGNLRYLVRTAGVLLDDADDTMVYQAIKNIAGSGVYAPDTGTVNHLAVALPGVVALQEGMMVLVKVSFTNTAPADLNVNSLGAVAIKHINSTSLIANDLVGSGLALLGYDGVNWQLLSMLQGASSGTAPVPLPSDTTIYVNKTTGSDTIYDGTSSVVSGTHGPFASIGRAVVEAWKYAPGPYTMTISVAAGTYVETVSTPKYAGPNVNIVGASVGSVTINPGNANCLVVNGFNNVTVQQLTAANTAPTGAFGCFVAYNGAALTVKNCASGPCGNAVFAAAQNSTILVGNHSFAGNANFLYSASYGSTISFDTGATQTMASAFTLAGATVGATVGGYINVDSVSPAVFVNSGNVTGQRYSASLNGVVDTKGRGASYFPGTSAGATATGGQYS